MSDVTSQGSWRHRSNRFPLTDLNRRTTALYNACRGKHTPSGDTVSRNYPATVRILPTCARCGVPYGGPRTSWNGVSKERAG